MEPGRKVELSEKRRALLQKYLRGEIAPAGAEHATIPKRSGSGPVPLSYPQQQIWSHAQLAGECLIYNEPITIRRRGALDRSALERSFTEIVRRHEAWRTTFHWDGDEPAQMVQPPPAQIAIPFTDLRSHPDPEAEAIRLATDEARRPFDLARGPLYRLRLVRLQDADHRLFLTLHHLIFDGVSLYRVLLPELIAGYEAFAKNQRPALRELPIQYPDYAVWQRAAHIPEEQFSYWESILRDLPVLDFLTDHPRPALPTFAGEALTLQVAPAVSAALKELSQEQAATPFMTMVAALTALLHGYTGQEDIVIGGISSGRNHTETQNLLGCFLNTVVIRCAFSKELPFTEHLARVKAATLGAVSHDSIPFELLVQKFAGQRDPGRAPLLQVLLVVEPPLPPLAEGWAFTHMDVDPGTAKFDLQLGLDDRPDGLFGRFIYNTALFERPTIELLKSRWLKLLERIAAAPTERISDLLAAVWRETERKVPSHWHGARTPYPRDATIHSIFEEQARRTPSAVALAFRDEQLTYDQLNRRANQLARHLKKLGVEREVPVGVLLERSCELVIALLAILKAGGAYLPLNPSYPAARIAFMIDDAQTPVILTQPGAETFSTRKILGVEANAFAAEDDTNLAPGAGAEDLAYMIYTSGSTGIPKGVAVPHRAVVRLVKETTYASFSPNETFLLLAPISFDASTFEIWGALLNGAKLVVMPPAPPTLEEIGSAIRIHGVTTLWLTAGLFNAMVDSRLADLQPLHQLLAGGDVLSVAHVSKALRALPHTRLINGYGPTESTTFACCHTIDPNAPRDESIPIGKPIANTTAYILDAQFQPLAIGQAGELFLGGDGLARGYWRRPELTAEKFIADPFSAEPDARLYKTGDLARWRDDGTIEFLGRGDTQVKLRGFRIEPAEIENVLKQQPGVIDSAVIVREDTAGEKRLVAYVVGTASQAALLAALKNSLPDYMVPSAIVTLSTLPRTPNGKLDRAALPVAQPTAIEDIFVRPGTPLEERLARIWSALLKVEQIGTRDNFFELGGHSLLGLRLVNQLREALGEHLSPVMVFEAPTVAAMAKLLETKFAPAVARWMQEAEEETAARRPSQSVVPVDRGSRRARGRGK
jgi:aspartate racemase